MLLARDAQDLEQKQQDREFPTCPPVLEKGRFSFGRSYVTHRVGKDGKKVTKRRKFRVPHHAAVFGPTRWTNLYFPARLVFWGDVIAGPLVPLFGSGIRDVPVRTTRRMGLLSHTLYWDGGAQGVPEHIQSLRNAVDLPDTGVDWDGGSTGAAEHIQSLRKAVDLPDVSVELS